MNRRHDTVSGDRSCGPTGSNRRLAVETALLGLASAQHGLVTRVQLLQSGMSADMADRRLKDGRLRPLHRGIYLVGPVCTPHARFMAAQLACGASAVVSHRSAACIWNVLPCRGEDRVEVSVTHGHRRRPEIRIHRVGALKPDEIATVDGIRVTTVARTLRDLAGAVDRHELEGALARAFRKNLVGRTELLSPAIGRRRGASRLRDLLGSGSEPALTRSEAEERFLALIRKAQLPKPAVNANVAGHEVDFVWWAARFVVEIDGRAYHSSAAMFESDRRRDAELAAVGMRVVRVTWRQLVNEPEAVLVRLAQALVHGAPA